MIDRECPNCGEQLHLLSDEEWYCTVCEHNTRDCNCTYCHEQRDASL